MVAAWSVSWDFAGFLFSEAVYGTWLQFLKQMEQFMNENPDIPFFNISFEEAKKVSCAGDKHTKMR